MDLVAEREAWRRRFDAATLRKGRRWFVDPRYSGDGCYRTHNGKRQPLAPTPVIGSERRWEDQLQDAWFPSTEDIQRASEVRAAERAAITRARREADEIKQFEHEVARRVSRAPIVAPSRRDWSAPPPVAPSSDAPIESPVDAQVLAYIKEVPGNCIRLDALVEQSVRRLLASGKIKGWIQPGTPAYYLAA